ncbi:LysE family translocator [Massilia endophytica]|uniref:LysE family translocator n=1 Tax=Massilia endophytica TaxID=2899220 RepID=UPI001E41EF94|nr:LysE family translocator [Massilia endophytica]UGQ47412.1 LysE family translocator [Massilia endophytica]
MELSLWLPYLAASLLTAFTPGQAVLLTVSNTLQHGGRKALLGSAGNALGICVIASVAAMGVASLMRNSPNAFLALKLAGGAYLVYLGARQWSARNASLAGAAGQGRGLFAQGMLVALTNPKGLLFFAALFPQFVRTDRPLWPQFLILTATFAACAVCAHAVFVLITHRARHWLTSPRRLSAMRKASACAFVAMGVAMLYL